MVDVSPVLAPDVVAPLVATPAPEVGLPAVVPDVVLPEPVPVAVLPEPAATPVPVPVEPDVEPVVPWTLVGALLLGLPAGGACTGWVAGAARSPCRREPLLAVGA